MNLQKPYSPFLNHVTVGITGILWPQGYDVSDEAPNTYTALLAHYAEHGRIAVSPDGSAQTIFGSADINIAFRAWHDWCHIAGDHDFSVQGEAAAAQMQQQHVRMMAFGSGISPRVVEYACLLIEAEVNGQRSYYERTGRYVRDQRGFAQAYLARGAFAVEQTWH